MMVVVLRSFIVGSQPGRRVREEFSLYEGPVTPSRDHGFMAGTGQRQETAVISGHLALRCLGEQTLVLAGQSISVSTVHAAKAFFLLALSPECSRESRELGGLLWPDAPESRLASRLATMTWQMRAAAGDQAWRVQRTRTHHVLEIEPGDVDLLAVYHNVELLRTVTINDELDKLRSLLLERLRTPLLPAWSHEAWVQQEQKIMTKMAEDLDP